MHSHIQILVDAQSECTRSAFSAMMSQAKRGDGPSAKLKDIQAKLPKDELLKRMKVGKRIRVQRRRKRVVASSRPFIGLRTQGKIIHICSRNDAAGGGDASPEMRPGGWHHGYRDPRIRGRCRRHHQPQGSRCQDLRGLLPCRHTAFDRAKRAVLGRAANGLSFMVCVCVCGQSGATNHVWHERMVAPEI